MQVVVIIVKYQFCQFSEDAKDSNKMQYLHYLNENFHGLARHFAKKISNKSIKHLVERTNKSMLIFIDFEANFVD